MLRDAKVFKNAQRVPKADSLERARDPQDRNLMRPQTAYIVAQESDLTLRWTVKTTHKVEDCRLAGAVRAYQAHQFTPVKGQVKIMYRPQTAEKVRQALYFQKSHVTPIPLLAQTICADSGKRR